MEDETHCAAVAHGDDVVGVDAGIDDAIVAGWLPLLLMPTIDPRRSGRAMR